MGMNVNNTQSIGNAIRRERKKQQLTQEELAQAAEISINSLRLYEGGKRVPDLIQASKIADALSISIDAIIPMTIGRYVLRAMQQKHLTLSDLATAAAIKEDKLHAILCSEHVPISHDEKNALNQALGIDLDVFSMMGLEVYEEPSDTQKALLTAFDRLNDVGQQKAVERVQELGQIPAYQKAPPQD